MTSNNNLFITFICNSKTSAAMCKTRNQILINRILQSQELCGMYKTDYSVKQALCGTVHTNPGILIDK